MTIIDRYVREVGIHLPVKQRADIEAEIKSSIQDSLQEKSTKTGIPVDDAMTLQTLKELGRPEKIAASYMTPRYLIGPELFPVFWLVLKISLAVVGGIALIVLAVRIAIGDAGTWPVIGDGISSIFNWLVVTLGWVVMTFAVLERVWPALKTTSKENEWDPAALMKKPEADVIPLSTPIVAIVFLLAALVVFNIFPEIIAIKNPENGGWVTLISLSDGFFRVMPLLNVLWILTIVYHCVTLVWRRWLPATRLVHIGLQIFNICILVLLITGPGIIVFHFDVINNLGTGITADAGNEAFVNTIMRGVLGVAVAVAVIEIGRNVYKLLSSR